MFSTREQFWALIFLLFCVGTLGMAPAACVVMLGKALDAPTLATLDKTVASLTGVLGLLVGKMVAGRGPTRAAPRRKQGEGE